MTHKKPILACLLAYLLIFKADASWAMSDKPNASSGEVGAYIVNGVTFSIPKSAFLTKQDEGENKSLHILLSWPELGPASSYGDQKDVISVGIYSGGLSYAHYDGEQLSTHLIPYRTRSRIDKTVKQDESGIWQEYDAEPIFLGTNINNHLDYYKLPRVGDYNVFHRDFYIKGDVQKPDFWYMCEKRRCQTSIPLNHNIRLDYSHRRDGFFETKIYDLREKLVAKIQSFIIEGK